MNYHFTVWSDDEEDIEELISARKRANTMHCALNDTSNMLRSYHKYGFPEGMTADELVEKIRTEFWEIITNYGIEL